MIQGRGLLAGDAIEAKRPFFTPQGIDYIEAFDITLLLLAPFLYLLNRGRLLVYFIEIEGLSLKKRYNITNNQKEPQGPSTEIQSGSMACA